MRTTAVIVSYRSATVLAGCLQSVSRAAEVIVVDNASDDNSLAVTRAVVANATVIPNTVNQGYGRANNQGLNRVKTEFALVINPDARIDEGSLESLIAAADRYPDAAILAPAILDNNGNRVRSHNASLFHQCRMTDPIWEIPQGDLCVDFLSGAVMLLRMRVMKSLGFFDPNIFLYFEDDDICLRVRANQYSLVQVPIATVHHVEGTSSPQTEDVIYRKNWHFSWSRHYLEEKYRGRVSAYWRSMQAIIWYLFCLSIHFVKRHKGERTKYAGRLAGVTAFIARRTAISAP